MKKEYKAQFYSGFFGILQDRENKSLRPIIGYVIVETKNKKEEELERVKRNLELMKIMSNKNNNI